MREIVLQRPHITTVRKKLVILLRKIIGPGSPRFSQRIELGSSADLA